MAFDIGGTFTDFVLAGVGEAPRFLKIAPTPSLSLAFALLTYVVGRLATWMYPIVVFRFL